MGWTRHHAIVVTGIDLSNIDLGNPLEEAHSYASELFPWVSPISPKAVNGWQSFFVPPDGSKEGWEESDEGDTRRKKFINFLRKRELSCLSWVEVQYGDDANLTLIVSHSDEGKEVG